MSKDPGLKIIDITHGNEQKHPPTQFPDVLPQHEFSMLIIAPKGAGKTNLICNLIKHQYKAYFHNILVCSPTVENDEKWEIIKESKGLMRENKKLNKIMGPKEVKIVIDNDEKPDEPKFNGKIPDDNFFIDLEEVPKRMAKQNETIHNLKKKYGKRAKFIADRTLLVLDDQAGLFKAQSTNNPLANFVMRHRHFGTSVIIVTQAYKAMTKAIRIGCNAIIIFEIPNASELEEVYDENPANLAWEEWKAAYDYCMAKPFGFMYINTKFERGKRMFCTFEERLQVQETQGIPVKRVEGADSLTNQPQEKKEDEEPKKKRHKK